MWQARCEALAIMVNAPSVPIHGLGPSLYDRQARLLDEWSKALLTRVLAYTSTSQGKPLAETLRPWGLSLRKLAAYRPEFTLDPVERGTLLSILRRLCTSIDQEPDRIQSLAVSTAIDCGSSDHPRFSDTFACFLRPPGLWIL